MRDAEAWQAGRQVTYLTALRTPSPSSTGDPDDGVVRRHILSLAPPAPPPDDDDLPRPAALPARSSQYPIPPQPSPALAPCSLPSCHSTGPLVRAGERLWLYGRGRSSWPRSPILAASAGTAAACAACAARTSHPTRLSLNNSLGGLIRLWPAAPLLMYPQSGDAPQPWAMYRYR